MKLIPFTPFFERVCAATDIKSQTALATALGVNRSAITQAKLRDAVPQKWILVLSRKYLLSPDWLEFGLGTPQAKVTSKKELQRLVASSQSFLPLKKTSFITDDFTKIPKVSATLCAGGGSYDVSISVKEEQFFPTAWVSRMGTPSSMVLMDVTGTSMEPTIFDGDTVLIDQSQTSINSHSVWAVGVDDTIFLKRVDQHKNIITLISDNNSYVPIQISGDELNTFRVIGKVIWLCRDCRFL